MRSKKPPNQPMFNTFDVDGVKEKWGHQLVVADCIKFYNSRGKLVEGIITRIFGGRHGINGEDIAVTIIEKTLDTRIVLIDQWSGWTREDTEEGCYRINGIDSGKGGVQ